MDPIEIKINLMRKMISQSEIARRAGVSRACITRVIKRHSRSERVQGIIAEAMGMEFGEVWKAA